MTYLPIESDPFGNWIPGPGTTLVSYDWQAVSLGGAINVAGREPAIHGGGTETAPMLVRVRISAEQPDRDDAGDVLELVSQRWRRVSAPADAKVWLKADVSQTAVLVEPA